MGLRNQGHAQLVERAKGSSTQCHIYEPSGAHSAHRHIAHVHTVRCREAEEDCCNDVLRM